MANRNLVMALSLLAISKDLIGRGEKLSMIAMSVSGGRKIEMKE